MVDVPSNDTVVLPSCAGISHLQGGTHVLQLMAHSVKPSQLTRGLSTHYHIDQRYGTFALPAWLHRLQNFVPLHPRDMCVSRTHPSTSLPGSSSPYRRVCRRTSGRKGIGSSPGSHSCHSEAPIAARFWEASQKCESMTFSQVCQCRELTLDR